MEQVIVLVSLLIWMLKSSKVALYDTKCISYIWGHFSVESMEDYLEDYSQSILGNQSNLNQSNEGFLTVVIISLALTHLQQDRIWLLEFPLQTIKRKKIKTIKKFSSKRWRHAPKSLRLWCELVHGGVFIFNWNSSHNWLWNAGNYRQVSRGYTIAFDSILTRNVFWSKTFDGLKKAVRSICKGINKFCCNFARTFFTKRY